MRTGNKRIQRSLITVLIVVTFLITAGWLKLLGTKSTEFDVESGRVRTRVFLFGIVDSEVEMETDFSRAVEKCGLRKTPADFRHAGSTSTGLQKLFGTLFECSKYGSVIGDTKYLMRLFELNPELRDHECEIIMDVMRRLKSDDIEGVRTLVFNLFEKATAGE